MKKVALASVLAIATASASFAGGYSEPVIEAPVIVEEASTSSIGSPLATAALVALGVGLIALAASDDS